MTLKIELDLKKVCRKAFFGEAKKRYALHVIYDDGKPCDMVDVTGFEVRRSDASQFSRVMQKRVFEMILREDRTKDEVLRYIGDEIDRIRQGRYTYSEIGIPKGMTMEISEYGSKYTLNNDGSIKHTSTVPCHVRAVKFSRDILGIELSSKPKLIYIKGLNENLPKEFDGKPIEAICFDEDDQIPPGTILDVETMLEKSVRAKFEPIFDALGWDIKELNYHWKRPKKKSGDQLTLF